MSEISRQFDATGKLPDRQIPTYTGENESQWVGWISFASTILILLGSFHIIEGLVALFRDEVFVVRIPVRPTGRAGPPARDRDDAGDAAAGGVGAGGAAGRGCEAAYACAGVNRPP